ncbi:hypothetical protein HAX54_016105 [Datura stramonium]|uniref:Agenet domain-containing protein n=1 Tax=Datura stramonium TaxID=4076 RepID=A0ABS8RZV8_DATST|nr:hypothetical protein [Datura stramonium]
MAAKSERVVKKRKPKVDRGTHRKLGIDQKVECVDMFYNDAWWEGVIFDREGDEEPKNLLSRHGSILPRQNEESSVSPYDFFVIPPLLLMTHVFIRYRVIHGFGNSKPRGETSYKERNLRARPQSMERLLPRSKCQVHVIYAK